MRDLEKLLHMNGRVYVHLADREASLRFLNDAEEAGFTFPDGVPPTAREGSDLFAVNRDRTINYVGFVGHVAYGCTECVGGERLIRVEYGSMI